MLLRKLQEHCWECNDCKEGVFICEYVERTNISVFS
jgi:hypothetical protein